jgi:hypothetical protein
VLDIKTFLFCSFVAEAVIIIIIVIAIRKETLVERHYNKVLAEINSETLLSDPAAAKRPNDGRSSQNLTDNIIGDMLEEYNQLPYGLNANLWLCRQALKSVLPLFCNLIRNRLASYFGERIR